MRVPNESLRLATPMLLMPVAGFTRVKASQSCVWKNSIRVANTGFPSLKGPDVNGKGGDQTSWAIADVVNRKRSVTMQAFDFMAVVPESSSGGKGEKKQDPAFSTRMNRLQKERGNELPRIYRLPPAMSRRAGKTIG